MSSVALGTYHCGGYIFPELAVHQKLNSAAAAQEKKKGWAKTKNNILSPSGEMSLPSLQFSSVQFSRSVMSDSL